MEKTLCIMFKTNYRAKDFYLNPAIGKFAGDARHQWCRRICILQAIDNDAYSVNLPIPKGKENEKNSLNPNDELTCQYISQ